MADKNNEQLDRIERKVDELLSRLGTEVAQADTTMLTVVRIGDTSLIPSDHELRKRTAERT